MFYIIAYLVISLTQVFADNILILGGNGMIGSELASQLLAETHNLTVVHRDKDYWDYRTRIAPHVKQIICDRSKGLQNCKSFTAWLKDRKLDAVVDLTGYTAQYMDDTLPLLGNKTNLYIYISTVQVYEVCEEKNHKGPTKEEDSKKPDDEKKRDELHGKDEYGFEKLQCEEAVIAANAKNEAMNYVIFRLADVIGPRDNTDRWWVYQFWLRMRQHLANPVMLPERNRGIEQSFVYVNDVATAITSALRAKPPALNKVYNLGWSEGMSTEQMLTDLASEIGESEQNMAFVGYTEEKSAPEFYASVRSGPIDNSRAMELLGWKPTPWKEALKHTAHFYEQVMKNENNKHMDRRNFFIFQMLMHMTPEREKDFFRGVLDVYNIDALSNPNKKDKKNESKEEL